MDRNCLFSERRAYCIFSTFLGSNQRYHWIYKFYWKEKGKKPNISCFDGRHKTFYKYSTKRGYWNSLQSVWKFPQSDPPFSPTHYLRMRKMLRLIRKWVYLEPNKKFYVSPSNFFNPWIFGGWGRLRLQRLRGSRMWTLNYLTMVYDRMRITRRKVKLLLGNNHELLW